MLAEFFNALHAAAAERLRPAFYPEKVPGKTFVSFGNGEFKEFELPPPDRNAQLDSYESLVAYLGNSSIAPAPEVYVRFDGVRAFLDRGDRRCSIDVTLNPTRRFLLLTELASTKSFAPKAAIQFLRMNFDADQVAPLVKALSRVDFKRAAAGTHRTERGREALGKSVEAEVQQIEDIPETFTLLVDAYSNIGFAARIEAKVSLDLDLENERIVFFVQADELERARVLATKALRDSLAEEFGDGVPVFMGAP